MPTVVADYVAAQVDAPDPCLKLYAGREKTRLEHEWEIREELGYTAFSSAQADGDPA